MYPILSIGHGGLINGEYTTRGKRKDWGSYQINEGVLNRALAFMVSFELDKHYIPNHILNPENSDISLRTKYQRANKISSARKDAFLISIHHNAFEEDDTVNGFEIFTYFGHSEADEFAEFAIREFAETFLYRGIRKSSPETWSKEAKFTMLRRTKCPAVLFEFGFMTNPKEAQLISDLSVIAAHAKYLAQTIIKYQTLKG